MAVVDEAARAALVRDFGEEGARELVAQFLDLTAGYVDELVAARDAGDATALASAAHRIRGGAPMVGAAELARATGAIEHAARAGTVAPEAAGIEALWATTAAELRAKKATGI